MTELSYRLLGSLDVAVDGAPVTIKSARQRVILVTLLMAANHLVTVERLIDTVWDGEMPETARGQIQFCVSELRRRLGDVIETKPGGYAIRVGSEQLDCARFDCGLARAKAAAAEGRSDQAV